MACDHTLLTFGPSPHADDVGFKRAPVAKRIAACTPSGRIPTVSTASSKTKNKTQQSSSSAEFPPVSTFPGPLILPGDDLAYDTSYPPQSLRSWIQSKDRNDVVEERKTIYVIPAPAVGEEVSFVNDWAKPTPSERSRKRLDGKVSGAAKQFALPKIVDVVDYLQAFYQGLTVKALSNGLRYTTWESTDRGGGKSKDIAIQTHDEIIQIRYRARDHDGVFPAQLNLNDLLEVAISILPADAYALLVITPHDLYEDDDDDFCCGRAYGGSRVAVVSMARYNPVLDALQGIETAHAWPASHCRVYVESLCELGRPLGDNKERDETETAMGAAVAAIAPEPAPTSSQGQAATALWLGRVCKTASHELGHCFGMDHCTYFACIMQGTAGLVEDARQPPYLCPVDLAKTLRATALETKAPVGSVSLKKAEIQRYRALRTFCLRWPDDRMFRAFRAWLDYRIAEIDRL